ncbi:MAG TPA: DUF742 domain-containing protein [Streptosporangiaceae bacterium]|nr:DUF742 domain-containing protein [Streptosporangiaceae bacterium]
MNPRPDDSDHDSRSPVVRPYALTAGRTRPSGPAIDLIALVSAIRSKSFDQVDPEVAPELGSEHARLLRLCRLPVAVADLAATLDLPLGVVRILIADLREHGLVSIYQPNPTGLSDVRVLKEVADALRKL